MGKPCWNCKRTHDRKVFVSHSRRDKPLISVVRENLCKAGYEPVLFEFKERTGDPASKTILNDLHEAVALLVLLGSEVSRQSWTQAWIGFEVGAFAYKLEYPGGDGLQPEELSTTPRIVLAEDIEQISDAAVPSLQAALLLDFSNQASWDAMKLLVELIDDKKSQDAVGRGKLWSDYNVIEFPQFRCAAKDCQHRYRLFLWAGNLEHDDTKVKKQPLLPQKFAIKCSACRTALYVEPVVTSETGVYMAKTSLIQQQSNDHIAKFISGVA